MDECKSIVLRKILVMTLIFVLMTVVMPAGVAAGKTYKDVDFPLGDKSFADGVVDFRPGKDTVSPYDNPQTAIGPPEDDLEGVVALGHEGILTVRFTDNYLIDVDGPDLYVFEFGPAVEPFKVEISKDGSKWIDLGTVRGQPTSLDIHGKVAPGDKFSYVRITDANSRMSGHPYAGADIDAVGAIGAEEKEPDKAELEISKPYTPKTKYFNGETVRVNYWVKNVGTADVDEYQAAYHIIDPSGKTVYKHTSGKHSINVGEKQKWYSEKWQVPSSALSGTYAVKAQVRWLSAGKYIRSPTSIGFFQVTTARPVQACIITYRCRVAYYDSLTQQYHVEPGQEITCDVNFINPFNEEGRGWTTLDGKQINYYHGFSGNQLIETFRVPRVPGIYKLESEITFPSGIICTGHTWIRVEQPPSVLPPAPTTCGDYGQPCCQPGNICYEGECQNRMCIHCGYWGEPCCEGRTCIDYDSVCEGPGYGICWHPSEDCGHVGYRPCMRDGEPVCYYGVLDRGRNICLACGDYEQPCCQYTDYPCDYGACTVGYPYIGGFCKRVVATSTPTIKPTPTSTIKPTPTSRCIFATAAYNTPLHEDIDVLRDFRDEYLMTNPIGSVFVRAYYSTSPPIADVIRENEGLRMIVRQGIAKPSVYISRMFVR